MKYIHSILSLILIILTLSFNVCAKDITINTVKVIDDGESLEVISTDIRGEVDYSDLQVKVIRRVGNEFAVIYTGELGGYEYGIWNKVDFSKFLFLAIAKEETMGQEAFYIVPVENIQLLVNGMNNTASTLNVPRDSVSLSSNLAITSNIKLNNVTVDEKGMRIINNATLTCDFTVSNLSETDDELRVILSTYTSEGKLYNIKMFDVNIEAMQTESIEIAHQFDSEFEFTGKLMFWNKTNNFMPLRASIDFSQTSGINAYYYNADNRLLQIDKVNGKSLIFTYDNMGNLLSRTVREDGVDIEGNN